VDRDTLDVPGTERLVEHILAGGVQGLFVLGTTGEGPGLSFRLRCELIDKVCEQVAGRVPVLVGVTDSAFSESTNLAGHAADAGAAAVVLAPPFYYPLDQGDLCRYVGHIAAEMPLPVVLYNMPSHTKVSFSLDTLRRLMDLENVVGLKDSSGDMIYFHRAARLAAARPDWSVLVGPEELLGEAVLLGAHGGVCGGANLCPRLYVDLFQAARRGDRDAVARLHDRVMRISGTLYTLGSRGASVIQGLKTALACLGVCGDAMAEPFDRLDAAAQERVRGFLHELGLSPASHADEGAAALDLARL
jgi:4-hydroxy-tetrahydrodipicolinate synthase